jgi:hypothetical protein
MSNLEYGGPAFPTTDRTYATDGGEVMHYGEEGMTLRDYFAANVMPDIWAKHYPLADYDCALIAYRMADAMLRARAAS